MAPRLELQAILEVILGSEDVYFQPPNNTQMNYPCVVYQADFYDTAHADNVLYQRTTRYQVTVISRDPDSDIHHKVAQLPLCSFDRFFISDNLNHNVYNLFY